MAGANRTSVPAPVICVGNFTVGGAGKTPTALALALAAQTKGYNPGFLTRGYGGSLDVTTLVDAGHHKATAVGDEALLLSRVAPTVISRRRVDGALKLIEHGADLIIMDDGFQSARLTLDFALIVVDSVRGIGNGHLVPGGPVRAPIAEQMRHLSSILKVGSGGAADQLVRQASRAGKPVYVATLTPRPAPELDGKAVLAFAGIADPDKFYRTLESMGIQIALRRSFPDHHYFTEDEVAELMAEADRQGLVPVTTAKDAARLAGARGAPEELLGRTRVVEVDMTFDDPSAPGKIIKLAVENYRQRRLREGKTTG